MKFGYDTWLNFIALDKKLYALPTREKKLFLIKPHVFIMKQFFYDEFKHLLFCIPLRLGTSCNYEAPRFACFNRRPLNTRLSFG